MIKESHNQIKGIRDTATIYFGRPKQSIEMASAMDRESRGESIFHIPRPDAFFQCPTYLFWLFYCSSS